MFPITSTSQHSELVRSVERTFDLLAILERVDHPMGVSELARAAGIPKTTAQRLLAVLESRGFVEKQQGRYQVGVASVPLAHAFFLRNNLTRAALPVLQELAESSQETATLFVREGFDRVVVQRVEGANPLRYTMPIGRRLPLLVGGGKVLAAAMPKDELRQLLDRVNEIQLASGAVWSKADILAELEKIRIQGFSISRDERTIGVVSVGAAIAKPGEAVVAAIGVTGIANRMTDDKVEQLSIEIQHAAAAIAERCTHV